MIPKVEILNIGQDIEVVQGSTRTYQVNFEKGRAINYIDELKAMEQYVFKTLATERYHYEIYDWNYGFEISDLYGKPRTYVYSELKRRIAESIMQDDRITDVDDFIFEAPKRNVVLVKFTVHTQFGVIEAERQVNI